jgi:hypothetical protein
VTVSVPPTSIIPIPGEPVAPISPPPELTLAYPETADVNVRVKVLLSTKLIVG